jgi:hypothetical protein
MADAGSLVVLFGGSPASAGPLMPAVAGFKRYVQNETQQIAQFEKGAAYKRDIAYFKANISKIKSVDELVKNQRLLKVVLTAFNLQGDVSSPAKIKAVLTSDLSDRNSFANRLIDPRYQQLAREFNVKVNGLSKFKDSAVIADVVSKYAINAYERSLSDINPALRDAAYFLRNIGNVTDIYQILGDKVLRMVVTQALGLPAEIANQSVQKQKQLIEAKLDIKKFRTAATGAPPTEFAISFARKYLAAADASSSSSVSSSYLLTLVRRI